jgi:medium-chain acyl-[acyl-carrier-protein] hydrolase
VRALAQAIRPYLDLPYAFFGHSMGALISFQLARDLRRAQEYGPRHLFVSSNPAPQLPRHRPPIHQLPEAEFVEEIRLFQGTPEAVLQDAELRQLLLPILRADCALLETYVYTDEAPLECSISAFGGWQDAIVSHADLGAWHDQTQCSFTLRMFSGHHFYLHNVRTLLLQAISQDLQPLLGRMNTSECP